MPSPENGGYRIEYSRAVGQSLRELQRKASRTGQGKTFLIALRRIIRDLRINPHEVGEPLYRLPALRLRVRTVVAVPLVIDFAISEDLPVVYLKGGKLLSPR